jgi:tetratricopeptide (TPR) repeat protein
MAVVTSRGVCRAVGLAICLVLAVADVWAASPSSKQAGEELEFGYKAARRGYWQEALERFELANELTPNQPRILNNIAVALEANGRFDEARTTYQAALALAPNDSRMRTNFQRFEEFYATYVAPPEEDGDEPEADRQAPSGDEGGP